MVLGYTDLVRESFLAYPARSAHSAHRVTQLLRMSYLPNHF